jgi:Tol biopolymer transport system component
VVESQEAGNFNPDLLMFDLARGRTSRLTRNDAPDVAPSWSLDGSAVAFSSKRGTRYDVYVKAVDESTPEQLVDRIEGDKFVEHWSGDSLILTILRTGLWSAPVTPGISQPRLIRSTDSAERWLAEVSPDRKWIAYNSVDGDDTEVYVEAFGGSGTPRRQQVSARGGFEPHWRQDSRALYYLTADGFVASVALKPEGDILVPQRAEKLFRVTVPGPSVWSNFHVSGDGKRFVVNTLLGYPPVPPVHVVVNWARLLDR